MVFFVNRARVEAFCNLQAAYVLDVLIQYCSGTVRFTEVDFTAASMRLRCGLDAIGLFANLLPYEKLLDFWNFVLSQVNEPIPVIVPPALHETHM